ncbi:glutamine cyclotransferase [Sphingobium indicum IP26]|uniref:Glutamine cyclotransferase n=1 Tax=Sphingobium indicum F2 TaxID=1450518 RepID=A0A8E1C3P5_9SPHN|nr:MULTISPECIES: glutaminyl-peptide cyclotransferase [Sphingobium]EPR16672.1 glutamine cyclotransferase [Sphingobium indicum IP26]EQA98799.1 glutamine cyclotransferase [Sphingobium sp. HDIP04]KER37507.1 glutamine cyclotransferase [Sphingobium indicum F2]
MRRALFALLGAWLLIVPAQAETRWKLVRSYPHDPGAFTEGLFYHDGALYESTGLEGESEIRKVDLKSGKVLARRIVPRPYFGEGIVNWKDRLISLTWRHRQGFVWKLDDFSPVSQFRYEGEGWGLTQDGRSLIMSDGTAQLRFLDPEGLTEERRITVTWNGRPVERLNELEYVKGEIWANIWYDTHIVRIDPRTGAVIDWLDIAPLLKASGARDSEAVANGIAYDAKADRLFVTGKNWARLFEIRVGK